MQQPTFEIEKTMVQFTHLNRRDELHGEEKVPAVDLKMSMRAPNDALAMFAPDLRARLYRRPEVQGSDLADQARSDDLIAYCFPQIEVIKWAHEQFNNEVRFHYGLDGKKDIVLDDAKLNDFRIEPFDGGTVDLTWRVQARATHAQIGRLSERLSVGKVEVTIAHVEPEEEQPPLSNSPEPNPVEKRARRQKAHDRDPERHADPEESLG